jgi:adenylate cyclase class IV
MKEIEVKVIEINKSEVEKKLLLLGAKKVLDCAIETTIFDTKNADLKNSGKNLRLRKKEKFF